MEDENCVMKKINIEELKELQLQILVQVDKYCRSRKIEYFIGYGTLIGAVRHGGYIPWDDDIDICMTRPNYDKFIKSFNGAYRHLEVYAPELNWEYYAPYANVCDKRTILNEGKNSHRGIRIGVKIDIFPIDGVPSDIESYRRLRKRIYRIWSCLCAKRNALSSNNWKRKIVVIIRRIISFPYSYAFLQRCICKLSTANKFEASDYVDRIVFLDLAETRCCKSVFEQYIDIEFEGYSLRTIKEYDFYLRKIYGDYMQLPPKEEQVMRHNFEAYWLNG